MSVEHRQAARLIVLDTSDRLLLFRHTTPDGERVWVTPGGGLDGSESYVEAARREAAEELGITLTGVTLDELWQGVSDIKWGERRIRQEEIYYLVRVARIVMSAQMREVHRGEGIEELRWWTSHDVARSAERIYPTDLLARLAAHGLGL